eukprot:CAMPEP_0198337530 /NCGR_PEP_ID=MMETSP1450-20131203/28694_1 /TAXON_ID=753684 ORGANISM="Madagascaria erythrocladiodes, Strain CCMP3234" /NCGR_SAMPLE_ID=MMETSP1450 /ASSEMBLY_ACC=CAM_ASM_001115 /LENGTH=510 /DNA_ID=CAMNT_0044042349 /DNA_START=74 /DNA_END=1602 /DNA_ORIENTATION=-
MTSFLGLPVSVLTDSYKAGHYAMYPAAKKMVAYGEFRKGWQGDKADTRFVAFGLRYFVEQYLHKRWTKQDVERAELFYKTHNVGFTPYPYPKELFLSFIEENDGYMPIRFQALRDGSCAHVHVPVYQITAEGKYSVLATFLETLLTQMWYPSNVATLSRRSRDLFEAAFDKSVDDAQRFLVDSRLHDFGFRGAAGLESSVLGGCAHLLSFRGSDTMSACYYAQFELNGGKPVAQSVPATEHSVMTAWPTEEAAIRNMIKHFGKGIFACVLDSYDYQNCLDNVLPKIKEAQQAAGGMITMRPDSGDPKDAVLAGLRAAEKTFGATTNAKGFKVLTGAAVIQGDGMNYDSIKQVVDAVLDAKYAASNVAFGMGGGLLQKHNRDSMSFATKLCYIVYEDGSAADIMKMPKTDGGKISLPGEMEVKRVGGVPTVFPRGAGPADEADLLEVVYDGKPCADVKWETFDQMRDRVAREWSALPKAANVISDALQTKIDQCVQSKREQLAKDAAANGG